MYAAFMPLLVEKDPSPVPIFLWGGILFAAILIGFVAVSWLRRRLVEPDEAGGPGGFTLSDLRRMHKSGQISDEEYEKARALLVAGTLAAAKRKEDEDRPRRKKSEESMNEGEDKAGP